MTDYTKNASFTAKTGTPIVGADFDSEFDEIATAVASKEDKASKGVANGYCGLDASGLIDATDLPTTAALTTAINTFAYGQKISAVAPYLDFIETGVTANNTTWRFSADTENFYGYAMADNLASGTSWLLVARTGTTVDSVSIGGTSIYLNGDAAVSGSLAVGTTLTVTGAIVANGGMSASYLTSGTIPDGRIAVTGVTQHQASLSIAETQIADGTVFPRIGSTETITGSWAFNGFSGTANGAIVRSGAGAYPYFASATQSSGAIYVSTAAASGIPAAGDLWIQYTA